MVKGNPNSLRILNWIVQILNYDYRKQDKNIENSDYWTNYVSLCLFLCLLQLALPLPSSQQSTWTQQFKKLCRILNVTSHHSRNIVSLFGLKMVFSKFSLSSCVYNNFNLRSYLNLLENERLYKSFSFINSSVQIFLRMN